MIIIMMMTTMMMLMMMIIIKSSSLIDKNFKNISQAQFVGINIEKIVYYYIVLRLA